jgi:hypothetical protein
MVEYRQYVPADKVGDDAFVRQIRINVAQELSRQVSETDSGDEFFVEALGNMTHRDSRNGGIWIHSYLDRAQKSEYLNPLYSPPFKVPVPFAKVRPATDFSKEMLANHLQEKGSR